MTYEFLVQDYTLFPGAPFGPDTVRVRLDQVRPWEVRERGAIELHFRTDDPAFLLFRDAAFARERVAVTFTKAAPPSIVTAPAAPELDEVW